MLKKIIIGIFSLLNIINAEYITNTYQINNNTIVNYVLIWEKL